METVAFAMDPFNFYTKGIENADLPLFPFTPLWEHSSPISQELIPKELTVSFSSNKMLLILSSQELS
jgi:hypothetical protein